MVRRFRGGIFQIVAYLLLMGSAYGQSPNKWLLNSLPGKSTTQDFTSIHWAESARAPDYWKPGDNLGLELNGQSLVLTVKRVSEIVAGITSVTADASHGYVTFSYSDEDLWGFYFSYTNPQVTLLKFDGVNKQGFAGPGDLEGVLGCGTGGDHDHSHFDHDGFHIPSMHPLKSIFPQKRPSTLANSYTIGADVHDLDLLIGLTRDAVQWILQLTNLEVYIAQSVNNAQHYFDNSELGVNIRVVGIEQLDFVTGYGVREPNGVELYAQLFLATTDEMVYLHRRREQLKADIVSVVGLFDDVGGVGCLNLSPSGDPRCAYNVNRVQQVSYGATLAHEIGHNLGNHHSRNQPNGAADAVGGVFTYSTGWRFHGNSGHSYATAMTYLNNNEESSIGIPHFSTPNRLFDGVPMGSYSGPFSPSDNERSMNQLKAYVSAYRTNSDSPTGPPEIFVIRNPLLRPGNVTNVRYDGKNFFPGMVAYHNCSHAVIEELDVVNQELTIVNWRVNDASIRFENCHVTFENPGSAFGPSLEYPVVILDDPTPPTPTFLQAFDVTATRATVRTQLVVGDVPINNFGVCYGTNPLPQTECKLMQSIEDISGKFIDFELEDLIPGTKYFYTMYVDTPLGIFILDNNPSFTTLGSVVTGGMPEVSTRIDNSNVEGVYLTAIPLNKPTPRIEQMGICYAEHDNPKRIDQCQYVNATTPTEFFIRELNAGVTYYFRAFAMNGIGTAYDNVVAFKMGAQPPEISYVEPDKMYPGVEFPIVIHGKYFTNTPLVSFDESDVQLKSIKLVNSGLINAVVAVSPDALPGPRNLYVDTPSGRTTWEFLVDAVPEGAPIVTRVNAPFARRGAGNEILIHGKNFTPDTQVLINHSGFTISTLEVVSSSLMKLRLVVYHDTPYGEFNLEVENEHGASSPVVLTLEDDFLKKPSLTSVTPSIVLPGTTVTLSVEGSNFTSSSWLAFIGSGFNVLDCNPLDSHNMLVEVEISPGVEYGIREARVHNLPGGISEPFLMNVGIGSSIESTLPGLPAEYALYDNFPNPFNPSTTISFDLPTAGVVRIGIFDVLGRFHQWLVDGPMNAGRHQLHFDASRLASGVYLYRLETKGMVITKKMALVK